MQQVQKPKVVVITGASAGVGRATARKFARQGAHIGLLARGRAGLEGARQDVEKAGGKALAIPTDVTDAEQVEAAAERIEQELGPIDVWVNNAMTSVFSPVKEMQADEYRRVTEVCYLGTVYGTLSALRRMQPRNRGTIVQVGSALAYRGIPLQSAYCAAKHALEGFHESLRTELKHDESAIRLTMVQMPALNTPQFRWMKSRMPREAQPVPPIYQPEIAADAIIWASEHNRREVYVGFPAVKTIVGNKIAPWYAAKVLSESGYESQLTDEPRNTERPHNLWEPVDTDHDHGAHGVFDSRARSWSPQFWLTTHRPWVMGVGIGLLGAALAVLLKRT
jgi:NAD(P)-dependent dehydrogenase (short-subunit alcohol dehydrogenase family)